MSDIQVNQQVILTRITKEAALMSVVHNGRLASSEVVDGNLEAWFAMLLGSDTNVMN